MPTPSLIPAAERTQIRVSVEPAINAYTSLFMLYRAGEQSGLPEWITRTEASFTPDLRLHHRVILMGLYHAGEPLESWPSFPEYVAHLETIKPEALRDKLLTAYIRHGQKTDLPGIQPMDLLQSLDFFLYYIKSTFSEVDEAIETQSFHLLSDPPAMKQAVIEHLHFMWDTYLEPEWRHALPVIEESARAFQQLRYDEMSISEAFRQITGDEPGEWFDEMLDRAHEITFVPSAHIGPYKHKIYAGDRLWIIFRARLPEGAVSASPELSISEIEVHLDALADTVRLRILELIARHGELCTTDIMEMLNLPQSTAQRHLNQLQATGYLRSERREAAKCFAVNPDRIDDTFRALKRLVRQ